MFVSILQFYTDPVSGYAFRSRLDALRYLKTNDIGSCAIKPKKRDELGDLELIKNEIPVSELLPWPFPSVDVNFCFVASFSAHIFIPFHDT